jgi:hypothetical protein
MKIEYLARGEDQTLICVATDTHIYDARVFVGPGSPLQEVELVGSWDRINRSRDGGTTEINTAIGTFHVPSPLRCDPYAPGAVTLAGQPYTLMDVQDTSAILTRDGLVLR